MRSVYLKIALLLLIVATPSLLFAAEALQFPQFRHVDRNAPVPQAILPQTLTLLADADFPPFSFTSSDGKLQGVAVDLGQAVCAELHVKCQVKALPYDELLQALKLKQGDMIVGGPQFPGDAFQTTRPFYFSFSQFVARSGANFAGVDVKSLAGRRLGYVKGTQQELFVKKNFERSNLVPFGSEESMFESLRKGGLDLAFADSMHAAFWLRGSGSENCCVPFGQAFMDRTTFTHGLVMLVRAEDGGLRDALDYALDRLQEKGASARIFATYLPSSPF